LNPSTSAMLGIVPCNALQSHFDTNAQSTFALD
jgi:hypothetical protein